MSKRHAFGLTVFTALLVPEGGIETFTVFIIVVLLFIEWLVRGVILGFYRLFPLPIVLDRCHSKYSALRKTFSLKLDGPQERDAPLGSSTTQLLQSFGYDCEEHFTLTADGFHLVLHRIIGKREERTTPAEIYEVKEHGVVTTEMREVAGDVGVQRNTDHNLVPPQATKSSSPSHQSSQQSPSHQLPASHSSVSTTGSPILMVHGLMMNSEGFVCRKEVSLAIHLFDQGYDVWLGNNRGNKYSWMHSHLPRSGNEYWDFSIDELAAYDVPSMVEKVIHETGKSGIAYVGFSNGSAQMFAALSSNRELNEKVTHFIALSPACKIIALNPSSAKLALFYPLLTASSKFFFSVFGRKGMMTIADKWRKILSPDYYAYVVDKCVFLLFHWTLHDVSPEARKVFYHHIYSPSSVKTVHHWFQMLGSGAFEYYSAGNALGDIWVPKYCLKNVKCPVTLVYGAEDKLSDIHWVSQQLRDCHAYKVPGYAHLDVLISADVPKLVFPVVSEELKRVSSSHM
eukprot:GHVN01005398.1.p1 GENE.GHVN01005398.1~~GHVN01005398.1.p1  ORF type:complete len:512 (+),score=69.55 GHVN01005398.1:40-1575(+)